VTENS